MGEGRRPAGDQEGHGGGAMGEGRNGGVMG